jgi:hypothetical protein
LAVTDQQEPTTNPDTVPAKKKQNRIDISKKPGRKKLSKKGRLFEKGNAGGGTTSTAARWRLGVEQLRQQQVGLKDLIAYWQMLKHNALYNDGLDEKTRFMWFKEFGDRIYGKPKVEAELTVNSSLTIEQRRTQLIAMLGIPENVSAIAFGQPAPQREAIEHLEQRAFAVPSKVLPGPVEIHSGGEVSPGGDHLVQRPEECLQEGDSGEADRSPVQLERPELG